MFLRTALTNLVSLALICLTGFTSSVSANDTEAELATGGLVFTKSKSIEMLSEDLFISMQEIVIRYRFLNKSNDDVITTVAFPLPEMRFDLEDEPFSLPTDDPVNPLGFTTTVDGKRVEARIEHKAILEKRDQTAVLENYQVPLPFHLAEAGLAKLPNAARDELKRLGLVGPDDRPLWTVRTTFYWQQVFPAERETVIEHRYKPSVGGTVQTSLGSSIFQRSDYFREYQRKYCVDASFVREVARVTGGDKNRFMEHWISYILTTGANWAGPIREFRLVVDKGSPSNLVSFCSDGVRKIAPTRFEVTATNFVPKTDLSILILEPAADTSQRDESQSVDDDLSSSGCDDLWYRRNAIYKAGRYCFKTPRAIAQFGNAGCAFDEVERVPISEVDRALVDRIKSLEQSKHCPR